MTNTELGDNLIALGTLLKDDNATIQQVTAASLKCGLIFHFDVVPESYDDDLLVAGFIASGHTEECACRMAENDVDCECLR